MAGIRRCCQKHAARASPNAAGLVQGYTQNKKPPRHIDGSRTDNALLAVHPGPHNCHCQAHEDAPIDRCVEASGTWLAPPCTHVSSCTVNQLHCFTTQRTSRGTAILLVAVRRQAFEASNRGVSTLAVVRVVDQHRVNGSWWGSRLLQTTCLCYRNAQLPKNIEAPEQAILIAGRNWQSRDCELLRM